MSSGPPTSSILEQTLLSMVSALHGTAGLPAAPAYPLHRGHYNPRPLFFEAQYAAAMLAVLLLALAAAASRSYEYKGCYRGKLLMQELQLLLVDDLVSPAMCADACGTRAFPTFHLRDNQCWCASLHDPLGSRTEDRDCSTPCQGDSQSFCGGRDASSVYKTRVQPSSSSTPPLLALVMIVKDEAHTIAETLIHAKAFVDQWYILDTGSTDGTPEIIRGIMGDIPGMLEHGPFIDYGTARNRALNMVSQSTEPPVYTFMLSADEFLVNGRHLRSWCESYRGQRETEAFDIMIRGLSTFRSVRVARVDAGWRYLGRVHEALAPPYHGKKAWSTMTVPHAAIQFNPTDAVRRQERSKRVLQILQEEKGEKPDDARTSFYLASSYFELGFFQESIDENIHRVSLGGWDAEVYEALMNIARAREHIGVGFLRVRTSYLNASRHAPHRAEPLLEIARLYYQRRLYPESYDYAKRGSRISMPRVELFLDEEVYTWKLKYQLALAAYHIPERKKEGAIAIHEARLAAPSDPSDVESLYARYVADLGEPFPPSSVNYLEIAVLSALVVSSIWTLIQCAKPVKVKRQ